MCNGPLIINDYYTHTNVVYTHQTQFGASMIHYINESYNICITSVCLSVCNIWLVYVHKHIRYQFEMMWSSMHCPPFYSSEMCWKMVYRHIDMRIDDDDSGDMRIYDRNEKILLQIYIRVWQANRIKYVAMHCIALSSVGIDGRMMNGMESIRIRQLFFHWNL